jgi:integrase
MPRTSSIRYFPSRKAYYTQYRGRQFCLAAGPRDEPEGPTYRLAVQRFSELIYSSEVEERADNSPVIAIADRYLLWVHKNRRERTYQLAHYYLDLFIPKYGHLLVKELKPHHLDGWLDSQPDWGPGSQRMALQTIHKTLRWAVRMGLINNNPLAGRLTLPPAGSRSKDCLITLEEHAAIVAASPPCEADLWLVLQRTGARPGELSRTLAAHWHRELQAVVLPASSTKTKKDRTIFLPPECAAIVERLASEYPTGPLFRSVKGLAWKADRLAKRFDSRRRAAGLRAGLSPYSYRHTYATNALLAGESPAILAELLGTSIIMLQRHYSHLVAHQSRLRAAALRISNGTSEKAT